MLIVLDANIIVADSLLSGPVWRVLAQAAGDWGVRIVVPRVALVEADAAIGRMAEKATDELRKGAGALLRLGLPLPDDLISRFAESAQALKQNLADRLDELGVEIVEPPPSTT